jgi:hypothetical protein
MPRSGTLLSASLLLLVLAFGLVQELRLSRTHAPGLADPACALYFKTQKLCASVEWLQKPTAASQAGFLLKFWNPRTGTAQGPFTAPPGDPRVSLWMPAMGHGAEPVVLRPDERKSGIFQVSHAQFSMSGDWEIWVSLLDGDRLIEKSRTIFHL